MNATTLVIDNVLHCAGLFRLGRDIEAALLMVDLVDATVSVFSARISEDQAQLARIMSEILAAQQEQDWLGVADALQYELIPLVESV
jgi:hypothetical protein